MVESPKVSRKNKDPTGTKVKSSKKRRLDNEVVNQNALEQKVPSINTNDIDNNTNTDDVSNEMFNFTNNSKDKVVKFIRNKRTFCKDTTEYIHDNNLPENIFKTGETEESYTLEFQNAVNDLVQADNASQLEGNINNTETIVIINEVNNVTNLNDNQSDMQNLKNIDEFDLPMIEVNTVVPIQTLKDGIRDNVSTIKINTSPKSDEMKYIQVSIDGGKLKNDVEEHSNNKQNSNYLSYSNESKVLETAEVDENISDIHGEPGDNNANSKNAINAGDFREESNVPEAKSEESDDIERKVLELEKQVLGRFKGSLLDRMF